MDCQLSWQISTAKLVNLFLVFKQPGSPVQHLRIAVPCLAHSIGNVGHRTTYQVLKILGPLEQQMLNCGSTRNLKANCGYGFTWTELLAVYIHVTSPKNSIQNGWSSLETIKFISFLTVLLSPRQNYCLKNAWNPKITDVFAQFTWCPTHSACFVGSLSLASAPPCAESPHGRLASPRQPWFF